MLGLEGMHNPPVAAWNLFGMEQTGPAGDGPSEEAIDHWQADILRNFKEFSDKLEEKLVYTMEDAADGEEEGEFEPAG
jgi:hypothetical protein